MSSKILASLKERRNDLTRRVILDAAIEMLEQAPVSELTVRAAARRANISERTVFRYFATRDAFLDAVAGEMGARLDLPAPPKSMGELEASVKPLYEAFEGKANLTRAALHSEIYHRLREAAAKERWAAVSKIIDGCAPKRSKRDRKTAAANICYFLTATTWHYYRFYFGMSLEESISCAESAIAQAVRGICS